ncbi:MAG: hypothetical protein FWD23_06810 [Oscillospiraceae bacterium]|nr:hypothetical protein [Oscillospiraceae bacterium]
MGEKRKIGIIAFIIYLSIGILTFVYPIRFFFLSQFSELLQLDQLFLLFLYAVIPCVPAVILRAKFGAGALKWIALAATVLAGLCCFLHIFMPEEILYGKVVLSSYSSGFKMSYANEWIFIFTQFALTSSVPVLYCVAFAGDLYRFPFIFKKRQSILVILAPSLMFFLSLFIRSAMISGFFETFISVFTGDMTVKMILSAVYVVWALLLIFISHMLYQRIKKSAFFDNPKIQKYAPVILVCILIPVLTLAGVTLFVNNENELIKTYNGKYGRYEFSYKKSVLCIRKEIFEEYELTDGHIQKFFDGAETVYEKLADFFPKYDFPKEVVYHAVPKKWNPGSGYEYYGDKIAFNSWADPWTNETFYEESLFAGHLSMINAGFPSVACYELGHLFTTSASAPYQYYSSPYVWDSGLFAALAKYYTASEILVINDSGERVTSGEWTNPNYSQFFDWADKYGYRVISDTLKKVNNASPDIDSEQNHPKALFMKFLSQETGDDIKFEFDYR